MMRVTPPKLLILILALAAIVAVTATDAVAGTDGVYGHISGQVATSRNVSMSNVSVFLVNASNTSERIPGFTTPVDQNGFFQFTEVPNGTYKAAAWGPYLSMGFSTNITIEDDVTYSATILLVPQPYWGNMTVSRNPIPLEGAKTEITVTVYDYWENPVGPGWKISMHTTAGTLDPTVGFTDENSQFRTTLTSPDSGSYAEITEHVRGWNGTYYPLQKRMTVVDATPTASPSPTARPSVTPTPLPSATPTPTVAPNATTAPTATAKPTPGFEIALAILAFGAIAIASRMK